MNIPYWRLSGFYFFYFATLGSLVPYWGLFLKDSGYNAQEIGVLSALLISTKIIAPNLCGWLADKIGKSLIIVRWMSFLAALLFAGFLLFQGYFWFALITLGFSFFWNAALPQFEAATLLHLQNQSHSYSKIRLWGSIGFIAAVLTVGKLLDVFPIAWLPIVALILFSGNWLVALVVPEVRPKHHGQDHVNIWKILRRPTVLAFFMVGLLVHSAHAPYYAFYSIYLKENGYSATLTGGLWAIGVVAEIILFILMKPLLARFSLRGILLTSIFLGICRWLMIAWGADYLAVLVFAQVLHAGTFGSAHIAAIHLLHDYFGQQHQGKGQALYGSLSMGMGGVVGSFFSGHYWDVFGSQAVFSSCALACCLAWLLAFFGVGRKRNASQTTAFN